MAKLWSKGYTLNSLVEEFTVGDDYQLDLTLIPSDIIGSLAHAIMLKEVDLLKEEELQALRTGLLSILDEYEEGKFSITVAEEDAHTAIENRLVALVGEVGKRIHLGRSRNDQVLTALRLWMRSYLLRLINLGGKLVTELLDFADKHKNFPMPGRTHMQPAMPSSVGLWAGGFAEQLLDDLKIASASYFYFDQCPLGSGAGYGSPLPLNRERTAELMGFSRLQVNAVYGGLCRGKFEAHLLDMLDQVGITLSKLAQDLILFSMPEFAWFTLPQELCTGSSIMPQKRNPDALELIRAKAAGLGAQAQQIKMIIRSLPSGYNRDYQETKGPLLKASHTALEMLEISTLTIKKITVNKKALLDSFDPGIFATDAAIALVADGMNFRDAYHQVATHPESFLRQNPQQCLVNRRSSGTAGNLRLDIAQDALAVLLAENQQRQRIIDFSMEKILGKSCALF